jgi:hypothetical protein
MQLYCTVSVSAHTHILLHRYARSLAAGLIVTECILLLAPAFQQVTVLLIIYTMLWLVVVYVCTLTCRYSDDSGGHRIKALPMLQPPAGLVYSGEWTEASHFMMLLLVCVTVAHTA